MWHPTCPPPSSSHASHASHTSHHIKQHLRINLHSTSHPSKWHTTALAKHLTWIDQISSAVIPLPLLRIQQTVLRLTKVFELVLRAGVVRVLVGMVFN